MLVTSEKTKEKKQIRATVLEVTEGIIR